MAPPLHQSELWKRAGSSRGDCGHFGGVIGQHDGAFRPHALSGAKAGASGICGELEDCATFDDPGRVEQDILALLADPCVHADALIDAIYPGRTPSQLFQGDGKHVITCD